MLCLIPTGWLVAARPFHNSGEQQVRKLKFTGNKEFSDKELAEAISLSGSTWLGRKLLGRELTYYSADAWQMNERELLHFYRSEGFLNASVAPPKIKIRRKGKKVDITISVLENDPILVDSVLFIPSGTNPDTTATGYLSEKRKVVTAAPGKRFRDEDVWEDRDKLTGLLVDKGYAYAGLEPRILLDTTSYTASIEWLSDAGPLSYLGPITIEGFNRTPERLIRKQLSTHTGDLYSRSQLNRSRQQIYQLGGFRIVSFRAQLSEDKKDTIPISIILTEAPRTSTRAGVGYGREDKFRAFVEFRILNFPGSSRHLSLYAKHSALEPYRFDATITQPAVFSPNSTLELATSLGRQKEAGYNLLTYGATLSLLQRIANNINGTFSLYYEQVDLDTSSVAINRGVTDLNEYYTKGGVSTALIFDNSAPKFNPGNGFVIALNLKSNSMVMPGTYPFFKYQFEAKNYTTIGRGSFILASRLKYGRIHAFSDNGMIPVEERFFAGGSRSIRGWARQQLGPRDDKETPIGGNSIVEASIEPRIPLVGSLGMVVFADAGNVWTGDVGFSFAGIRYSAGAGLRFNTPIGPVGIDLARPIMDIDKSWQFHFNIGHAF